jgi:hypothetical protein
MATQVQVKLDTSADPPVTLVPNQVTVNQGNNTIEWTPFAQQSFTFADLAGLPNPPFSGLSVTPNKISIQDNNTASGSYAYSVTVNYNGQLYSSNPSSARSAHAAKAGTHSIIGGGSSPTIKNN